MTENRALSDSVFRRMGEPSWLILSVLEPSNAIPGVEIIQRVEEMYAKAKYPTRHLDPSTLHYALKRMGEDGLVRYEGRREVEVPGPHGSTHPEQRSVYVITAEGAAVLTRKRALEREVQRRSVALGRVAPAFRG